VNAKEAEAALAEWKRRSDKDARERESLIEARDGLIKAAHEAGVNIRRMHLITGVSRSTIYRVLGVGAGGEKEHELPGSARNPY
jgi:transcriptional regulator of acetoin/glycerol metabolism